MKKLIKTIVVLSALILILILGFIYYEVEYRSFTSPVNNNDVVRTGTMKLVIGPKKVDCNNPLYQKIADGFDKTYKEGQCYLVEKYYSDGGSGILNNQLLGFEYKSGFRYEIQVRVRPAWWFEDSYPGGERWFYMKTTKLTKVK